jgi:hypothetical protein
MRTRRKMMTRQGIDEGSGVRGGIGGATKRKPWKMMTLSCWRKTQALHSGID